MLLSVLLGVVVIAGSIAVVLLYIQVQGPSAVPLGEVEHNRAELVGKQTSL